MKIITHNNIVNLKLSPKVCYDWVEYMIAHKSSAVLPPKISLKPREGVFCNVMPSIVTMPDGKRYGGVKIVSRYPDRQPTLDGKLLLFDADKGDFKALLDSNWITSMRTGAVAVHSIKLFAKSGFKNISIMGLGNTARATVSVLAEIFKDKSFNVNLLKYKGQEDLFKERFARNENLRFDYSDSVEQLFRNTDVIISAATYLSHDVGADELYERGVLLVPIHTLGFTNCDLFFDKIYADDYGHVCHFKNFEKFKFFAEVSDVVNGKAVGRQNDDERIIAYNIGVSMHDVYFAANIYEMLQDTPTAEINFEEPQTKFYI